MSTLNFDATNIDPNEAFDPVPAGWYTVQITESEEKVNSKQTGSFLLLVMTVLDGEFAGRKLFERLNLNNPNPTAVEIAQRSLSAICHAVNIFQVADSTQLHNIPLQAKVAIQPAKDGYDASNTVKGYRALGSAAPAPTQPPVMQQPPVQTPPAAPAQPAAPVQQAWQANVAAAQQAQVSPPPVAPPVAPAAPAQQAWQPQAPTQPAAPVPVAPPAAQPAAPSAQAAPDTPPWAVG